MQYVQTCKVFDSLSDLAHDDSCFLLSDCGALIYKTLQIEAVCILEDHEDVLISFDCLVMPDAILACNHSVDSDLFYHGLHFIAREELIVKDLAGKDPFGVVKTRPEQLLWLNFILRAFSLKIRNTLGLHYSTVLTLSEDLIKEYQVVFDFTHPCWPTSLRIIVASAQ